VNFLGDIFNPFWATICKTVRHNAIGPLFCLSILILSVCDVGALWPNGWMMMMMMMDYINVRPKADV